MAKLNKTSFQHTDLAPIMRGQVKLVGPSKKENYWKQFDQIPLKPLNIVMDCQRVPLQQFQLICAHKRADINFPE